MTLSLLINFVKQDLVDRYSGSILGGLWSFIIPLVNIFIFVLIFSKIMGAKLASIGAEFGEYSYSIYLVSGILAWNSFANILLRTTNIFKIKASLIAKVNINLAMLPIYVIISESVIFIIGFILFMVFLILIGYPITSHWFFIPVIFLLQIIFAYGLGLLLSTLSVFIKDIREFVSVSVQIWFWCTPIVYVIDILPDNLQSWFQLNPMYPLISAYREIIIEQKIPDLINLSWFFIIVSLVVAFAIYLLKKLEKDLRDFI